MKDKSNLIHQNIHNLTSLWEEASRFNNSFVRSAAFNYSAFENRQWPNRLWFNTDCDQETILRAKNEVFSAHPSLTIPYWDIYGSNSHQLLEQNGFTKIFEQTAMNLQLDKPFEQQKDVSINLVSTPDEAILWSKLFTSAFGYEIHPNTVLNSLKNIHFYIAYFEGKAIGTTVTYQTGNVTGIHAMGIIPEGRRKGLANKLMKIVLNEALKKESEFVTLQASQMGKGLYLRLGFEEQFEIRNYRLSSFLEEK